MARFGLEQGMRQEMQLLPRMLQSLEVLQLPVGELATYLQEAALENEALQFTETTGQEAALPEAELRRASADAPGADGPTAARGGREATERHDAWLEAQPGRAGGLAEVLGGELALLDLDDELAAWVRLVVESLDDNGYLSVGDDALQALAAEQGLAGDLGALGEAIAVVQGLEPRGVGGRDVVETLLLQLDPADADYALLCKLVEEFLGDIARNKLPAVARELGVEVDRLKELIERLRELDPAPGAALSGETSPALRPDVFVEPVEAAADELDGSAPTRREYRVRVVDSGLPEVTLDAGVAGLCKDRAQPAEVRRYLREKLERARWLLKALDERAATLLAVATWVFDRQRPFLESGPSALRPLTMTAAAQDLEVHVSTVSRAVSGKHVDTPWGVLPLRGFFQVAAGDNAGVARGGVQEALRRLVEEEDKARPLSDDELVTRLRADGYRIARRTVAKYRGELGIESSYRRRQY